MDNARTFSNLISGVEESKNGEKDQIKRNRGQGGQRDGKNNKQADTKAV